MALVLKDRVKQTAAAPGTGTITLSGSVTGFQSFSVIGNGNTTYFAIYDPISGDWEVNYGTYTSSGTTLTRNATPLSSSAGGSLVNFTGVVDVFVTYPSENAVWRDTSGVVVQQSFGAITATSAALTSGTITAAPTNATDIVNKEYADSISSGLNYHQPVNYASTTTLPTYIYNNGASGVGATITAVANGALSLGGGSPTATQRVLVKDEIGGNAAYNGVYVVTQAGTSLLPFILTRATDYDTSGTGTNEIDQGDYVLVISGTLASTAWVQQTPLPITVGTTGIVFLQFNAPITYYAGTGLTLSPATTFNIATTGVSAATYGSASSVPVITVNAQGQATVITNTAIAINGSAVSGNITGQAGSVANALTAGTYLTSGGTYDGSAARTFAVDATDANTASKVVARDSSGNFSAGTITATLSGAATSATTATNIAGGAANQIPYQTGAATTSFVTAPTVAGTYLNWSGSALAWSAISLPNNATFNNGGAGDASGTTFNGSAARTISYNTVGASPLAGSSSLTTTGTVTSGTWSASFGAVSGANLTSLTAGNLSGTIPSAVLGNSTAYVGTTAVALNRASGNLALTGILSETYVGSTSGTTQVIPNAVAGTGTVLTLPNTTGTLALTSDLPTVNNATLTMNTSGTGLSGSQTFTANQATGATFTVASNATSANTISTIVARDASGNFSAGTITATLSGAATSATTAGTITSQANSATITATSANTASQIVLRDASGNFSAGTITATLSGNASTATTATNQSGGTVSATSGTFSGQINVSGSKFYTVSNASGESFEMYADAGAGANAWRHIYGGTGTGYGVGVGGYGIYYDGNPNYNVVYGSNGSVSFSSARPTALGYIMLDAGNYNSYAPTLTGTGASGTWGISISGNAATATTAANYLPLSGGTLTGNLTFSGAALFLNRAASATSGISFYSSSYTSWSMYMASAGATGVGPTANITAPSGTYVTSWAIRSFVENPAGYGWTFESGSATGQPTVVAEIRASDGIAKFAGGVVAPIFYDSNDTAYYVDPNSNSKLVNLGLGVTPDIRLSVNGDAHISSLLYMGGTAGSSGSWGSRDYTSSGLRYFNASTYEFNNYGYGSTYTFVLNASLAQHSSSVRAPIFYDSDNTGYYVDPNGTSVLNALYIGGRSTTYAMYYQGFTLDANTMDTNATGFTYAVNAPAVGPIAKFSAGGSYDLWLNASYSGGGGTLYFRTRNGDTASYNNWYALASYGVNYAGSLYATILYDSSNTAYYVDPASTSVLNNVTYANLYFSGDNTYGLIGRNGYLDTLNARGGDSLELNYYDGGSVIVGTGASGSKALYAGTMYSTTFYDSSDTAYYVDPASVSRLNNLLVNVGAVSNDNAGLRNVMPTGGSYVTTASSVAGAIVITLPVTVYPMIKFRVSVYTYDGLSFDIYCGGHNSGGFWYSTFAYMGTQNRSPLNVRFTYGSGLMYVYIGEIGQSWSYPQVFVTDVQVGYTNYEYTNWDNGWTIGFNSSTYNNVSSTHVVNPPPQSGNNSSAVYAPVFYDYSNTAYYADPNSTSNFVGLTVANTISGSISGNAATATNVGGLVANSYSTYGGSATTTGRSGYYGLLLGSGSSSLNLMSDGANGGIYRESTSVWVYYYGASNNSLGIMSSATSSSYALYVTGSIYATANVTAYSDRRAKKNIETIDNALDKTKQLRGVYYRAIEEQVKDESHHGKRLMGVIAQEVLEVVPEVVTYDKENDKYGVSYANMVGLLIEAVKELSGKVTEQDARIARLEALVNKLIGD